MMNAIGLSRKKLTGPGIVLPGPADLANRSRTYFGCAAGAGVCAAGARGTSPCGVSACLDFLVRRVFSPVVVAFFFFLAAVSPARPRGPACVWRSATSAASGAGGVSASGCGPFALGCLDCLGCLARAL